MTQINTCVEEKQNNYLFPPALIYGRVLKTFPHPFSLEGDNICLIFSLRELSCTSDSGWRKNYNLKVLTKTSLNNGY